MRLYESIFIARQDITAQDAEKLGEQFATIITENGGKILKQENWGLRSLAYKINKSKKGHYVLLNFEAEAATVTELERKYKLSEDIIRSLTVQIETFDKEPSIILRQDDDRDVRGDRGDRDRGDRDRGDRDRGDRDRGDRDRGDRYAA